MSKVWHALECGDLLNLVQQTVFLVGQTNNTIYHKRLSALAGPMKSPSQAKSMLKDESALSENLEKELLGKEFRDQITDIVKAQKQSKELLFNVFQ